MFVFLDHWHDILPRDGGHVVAVLGGGGKTSLLEAATASLIDAGAAVCVTTTTRTEPLDWPGLVVLEHDDLLNGSVAPPGAPIFVRAGEADGKWIGLAPEAVDALAGPLPNHVILVEADGSSGRPVKLHGADDPPLPSRTSLALVVVGLSALGRAPVDILHRHGRAPADHLELGDAEAWTWDHTHRLLRRPAGYLGRVAPEVPTAIALLQMDECDDAIGLFEFTGRIMDDLAVPVVLMGDTSGPEPRLRTACRAEEQEADDQD